VHIAGARGRAVVQRLDAGANAALGIVVESPEPFLILRGGRVIGRIRRAPLHGDLLSLEIGAVYSGGAVNIFQEQLELRSDRGTAVLRCKQIVRHQGPEISLALRAIQLDCKLDLAKGKTVRFDLLSDVPHICRGLLLAFGRLGVFLLIGEE